jgi:hypothetical protein
MSFTIFRDPDFFLRTLSPNDCFFAIVLTWVGGQYIYTALAA